MKLSVIMGIAHMTIGVLIKGTNTLFRNDYPSFFFEVVAGLVMLLGLFGWMDILIYGKWFFNRNFTDYKELTTFNG
jgi:V-type H+-transporting ATPase subunit a